MGKPGQILAGRTFYFTSVFKIAKTPPGAQTAAGGLAVRGGLG